MRKVCLNIILIASSAVALNIFVHSKLYTDLWLSPEIKARLNAKLEQNRIERESLKTKEQ